MKKRKFKVRYIFITLGAIIAILVIGIVAHNIEDRVNRFKKSVGIVADAVIDKRIDKRVDERISEDQGSDNIPDASGNFTDVSWPEDSKPSAPERTPAESEKITATVTNYGASPNDDKHSISIFESYDDAFDNAFVLPSGKNVNITLKANANVESIKATASGLNPDSGEFDEFDEFSFKSSKNSDNVYKLSFKVPDNPYGLGYKKSQVRFIAVFEIVTNEGTFYVSCAY